MFSYNKDTDTHSNNDKICCETYYYDEDEF